MKKIIAAIIRAIMPKAIRKHQREKKVKRIHNNHIMQTLLDNEHKIRDSFNQHQHIPSTTKNAILKANKYGLIKYNSALALKNADFR